MKHLILLALVTIYFVCHSAAADKPVFVYQEDRTGISIIRGKDDLPYQVGFSHKVVGPSRKEEVFHIVVLADPDIKDLPNDIATRMACDICCENVFAECFDRIVKDVYPLSSSNQSLISKPHIAALLRFSATATHLQYQDQANESGEEGATLLDSSTWVGLKRESESSVKSVIVEPSKAATYIAKHDFDIAFTINPGFVSWCKKVISMNEMRRLSGKSTICTLQ